MTSLEYLKIFFFQLFHMGGEAPLKKLFYTYSLVKDFKMYLQGSL